MRQLRVTVRSVRFRSPRVMRGRMRVAVQVTLNGAALGNPDQRWTVRRTDRISFDASYSRVIDVEGRSEPMELAVEPRVDEPGNTAAIGAAVRHRVPWPFSPRRLDVSRAEFAVEWEISQDAPPAVASEDPTAILACREDRRGGVLFNTATVANRVLRVEVHDVLPVPTGAARPRRPAFPRGTPPPWEEDARGYTAAELSAGTNLNLMENPAVIPIMPEGVARDATNAARFRVTYYRPRTLGFTEEDTRLTWRVVPLAGGTATFCGRSTGRKVRLHGVRQGEVGLEVSFQGTVVAVCRALVLPLAVIPFRCNVLYGHATRAGLRPRSTWADIQRHMLMCNRFLWQLGLKLEPHPDTATIGWLPSAIPAANVTPAPGMPGFFSVTVPPVWTRGFTTARPAAVNSLPQVFNFAYVMRDADGNLGAGCYTRVGGSRFITDEGTPSTSWRRPSGVNPDGAARAVRMRRLPGHWFFRNSAFPNRYAMYITNGNRNDLSFAGTIAHELLHILGLNHRVEDPALLAAGTDYCDRVRFPPRQNLMHWNERSTIAQDLDIIQARQVRLCPLFSPPAAADGGGAPAPAGAGGGAAPGAPPARTGEEEEEDDGEED